MRVASNGKVHRTPKEWREVFSRCSESGLNPREFCARESINWASFQRWHRKLGGPTEARVFVPVKTASVAASSWTVEITLPNNITLRFEG